MAFGGILTKAWNTASSKAKQATAELAVGARKMVVNSPAMQALKAAPGAAAEWAKGMGEKTAQAAKAVGAKAADAARAVAHKVGEKVASITQKVSNAYNSVTKFFDKVSAVEPINPCPSIDGKKPGILATALGAVNKLATAYSQGGLAKAAETGLGMAKYMYQEKTEKTLGEKFISKLKKQKEKIGGLKDLYKMGSNYKKTGYLNIKKGNLFDVAPGRYKLTTPLLRSPFATKYSRKILGKTARSGALGDIGVAALDIVLGSSKDKPIDVAGAANKLAKAAVKGAAKQVVSRIVTTQSITAGAAIGTMICPGIGTVIGGAVGMVAGVGLSVLTDEGVDVIVDAGWSGAEKLAGKVPAAAAKVAAGAEKLWDGAQTTAKWATGWLP